MMKTQLAAAVLVALSACATNTPPELPTGTWKGTATNGSITEYQFDANNLRFQYGLAGSGGFLPLITGSYSVDYQQLTLDGSFVDPETGDVSYGKVQFDSFYSNGTTMCDNGYLASSAPTTGIVATWTAVEAMQDTDASGNPVGSPSDTSDSYTFAADGSFTTPTSAGTYTVSGNIVTTTIAQNNTAAVEQFSLVDGVAMCDPAYTKVAN